MDHEKNGLGPHVGFRNVVVALIDMGTSAPGVLYQVKLVPVLIPGNPCNMHQMIVGGQVVVEHLLPALLAYAGPLLKWQEGFFHE